MQTYDLRDVAAHGAQPTPAVMRSFVTDYLQRHDHGRRADITDAFVKAWVRAGGRVMDRDLQLARTKKALLAMQRDGAIRQLAPGQWALASHR